MKQGKYTIKLKFYLSAQKGGGSVHPHLIYYRTNFISADSGFLVFQLFQ